MQKRKTVFIIGILCSLLLLLLTGCADKPTEQVKLSNNGINRILNMDEWSQYLNDKNAEVGIAISKEEAQECIDAYNKAKVTRPKVTEGYTAPEPVTTIILQTTSGERILFCISDGEVYDATQETETQLSGRELEDCCKNLTEKYTEMTIFSLS